MQFCNFGIPAKIRFLKRRGVSLSRLICVVLLAAAVASPSITRLWQKHNIAQLVNQYQSLVEQGCYQEAKWVANVASESYPGSSIAKQMTVRSASLLRLIFWNSEDESDPFSTVAFEFSDPET